MHHERLLIACASLFVVASACKKPAPSASGDGADPKATAASPPPADASSVVPVVGDANAGSAVAPILTEESDAEIPAAFVKFEDLLLPLVREPRSEARSVRTCRMIEKLRIASLAVKRSMPKGVDEAAWEVASDEMRGAFEGMGATCTDDPPNDSPDLAIIHKSYARLLELLPE